MKIAGVIPARYKSTRFPGKPLADICGRPMLWWVYQEAKKVTELDDLVIATESEKVAEICRRWDMKVMLTSDRHPTGTDRVAEVAQRMDADLYVIIMGDEPLIKADEIHRLICGIGLSPQADAVMLAEKFKDPVDVVNTTTIKLAINDDGYLIFMSRAAVPFPKAALGFSYYKNIGCYALRSEALDFFRETKPGNIEMAEEIELLRLLENHKKVLTVAIESDSMAVDTKKDLERVCRIMADRIKATGEG